MPTPDNRIKLPGPLIDFADDVGTTGQDHDDYPAPGTQARYDHQRLYLIGLLAQQSSFSEPSQYRDGTPWFDLNTLTLRIRRENSWISYADAIALTEPDSNNDVITLSAWYEAVQELLSGLSPEIVFSGRCTVNNTTVITIPESIRTNLVSDSRVFFYINGILVRPDNCTIIGSPTPTTIRLSGTALNNGDEFTVNIRRITGATFLTSNVVVP